MDESANKGMKLLEVKGSDAAITKRRETGRITVTGYDTGLPHDDVVRTLINHFASCGEITDVYIREIGNILNSYAFIYFVGEGAVDKALQISGRDVGGWKAEVEAAPVPECASRSPCILVKGFDTSLSSTDLQSALRKHFSSCGRVREVMVPKGSDAALVHIVGEHAAEKALELGVSSIQGRKVVAKLISTPVNSTVHRRRTCGGYRGPGKKAKMTAE